MLRCPLGTGIFVYSDFSNRGMYRCAVHRACLPSIPLVIFISCVSARDYWFLLVYNYLESGCLMIIGVARFHHVLHNWHDHLHESFGTMYQVTQVVHLECDCSFY